MGCFALACYTRESSLLAARTTSLGYEGVCEQASNVFASDGISKQARLVFSQRLLLRFVVILSLSSAKRFIRG